MVKKMADAEDLIEAINNLSLSGVDEFISKGGNVNFFIHGKTPLMLAFSSAFLHCSYGESQDSDSRIGDDIINRLLDAGADTNYVYKFDQKALMEALESERGHKVLLRLINAESNINAENAYQRSALTYAIECNYDDRIVTEIINKGADVHCKHFKISPFFYAVEKNEHPGVIEALIKAGANLHARDSSGRNLLMAYDCRKRYCYNVDCKKKPIIKLLLRNGINLKDIDYDGNTVIHHVSCKYLIKLSIRSGINIESVNKHLETPLTYSLHHKKFQNARTLLLLGAKPDCIDYAVRCYTPDSIIHLFFYCGANLCTDYFENLTKNDILEGLQAKGFYRREDNAVKAFMKNVLLFFSDIDLSDSFVLYRKYPELFQPFVNIYENELYDMKKKFVKGDLSFHEFCKLRKHRTSHLVDISVKDYNYKFEDIKRLFPNFYDLIIFRIEDNHRKNMKRLLCRSLEKIIVTSSIFRETSRDGYLDYDCLCHISRYLHSKHIYDLFLASIDSN